MTEATVDERRPEDDAECERLGCENKTHAVWRTISTAEEHIYPQGTPASAVDFDETVIGVIGSARIPVSVRSSEPPASAVDFEEIIEIARGAAHETALDVLTMGVVEGMTVRFARVYAYSIAAIERCPACHVRLPASLPLEGYGLDIAVLIHASHRLAESYVREAVA